MLREEYDLKITPLGYLKIKHVENTEHLPENKFEECSVPLILSLKQYLSIQILPSGVLSF